MKKQLNRSVIAIFLLFAGLTGVNAQTKIGYIEFQELLTQMPEYKKANTDMEAFQKTFQDESKKMNDEFEKKYNDYMANEAKMADVIKELKQKDLRDMQTRIQEFGEKAQESMRKKEGDLLKPIIEKAKAAIASVAKESGYTYVMDSSPGSPLIYKPDGDNMMNAVKKKLGIPTTVAPAAGTDKADDKK